MSGNAPDPEHTPVAVLIGAGLNGHPSASGFPWRTEFSRPAAWRCPNAHPCRRCPFQTSISHLFSVATRVAICLLPTGRRSNMRVGWLLSAATATVALLGAQAGDRTVTVRPPLVRMVEFKNFRGVSVKEIVNRLSDRDIQLVERPYNPQYVETAQGIVEEFLKEKGQPGTHVKPTVTRTPPHAVRVTFTAAP